MNAIAFMNKSGSRLAVEAAILNDADMVSRLLNPTTTPLWPCQIWRDAVDSIGNCFAPQDSAPEPFWQSFRYNSAIAEGVRNPRSGPSRSTALPCLDVLNRCWVVALPLLPTERSTGQVVMLEAMALGKPVVTTSSPGTIDAIRHGENGFLVEEEDPAALTHQVNDLLRDHDFARRIGTQAAADIREQGSAEGQARAKKDAMSSLLDKSTR